jgi:hypothetical protein
MATNKEHVPIKFSDLRAIKGYKSDRSENVMRNTGENTFLVSENTKFEAGQLLGSD